MKKNILVIVLVIVAVVIGIGLGYLFTNGTYHTNSNLAWRAQQAGNAGYTQGYGQGYIYANNQAMNDAVECGGAAVIYVVNSTSTGPSFKTACYK